MILLLGGTTEAKQAATCLEGAGLDYIYSTRIESAFNGKGLYRFGELDRESLLTFCRKMSVSLIIDACHPFAADLHQTVANLDGLIPVIRYERSFSARSTDPLVYYIADHTEALQLLQLQGHRSLLVLSGVKSIPLLSTFWKQHLCWVRILPRDTSLALAAHEDFPSENLLFGLPQELEEEISLVTRLQPAAILTKESGLNGKLDAKIGAAIACKTPIFIMTRPKPIGNYATVTNEKELLAMLHV